MLSRGYRGEMPAMHARPVSAPDLVMLAGVIAWVASARMAAYLLSK
jgi:hypothetical protein